MNAVKIVGMGLVTGLGSSVRQVYEAACAGKDTFRELTRFDASPYAQIHGGPLSDEQENQLRHKKKSVELIVAVSAGHKLRYALPHNFTFNFVTAP